MEPIEKEINVRWDYDNDMYSYFGYASKSSAPLKINVPDKFISIIKKLIPEIENVSVSSAYSFKPPGYYGITPEGGILIYVRITIQVKNQPGLLSCEEYSEKINDFFKMTYPNYDFVDFKVESVQIIKPSYYFEEFLQEFGIF
jgi:hypothetical protein